MFVGSCVGRYGAGQLKVMFIGGPNQRKDYHIEEGEEVRRRRREGGWRGGEHMKSKLWPVAYFPHRFLHVY